MTRQGIRFLGVLGLGIAVSIAIVTVAVDDPSTTQAGGAAFVVDSTIDAVDVSPGDGVCDDGGGNCTLRAAIMEANALAGADTITLPAGMYLLTISGANEDGGATGDLDISGALTITGVGSGETIIDGGQLDRVVDVLGATVGIEELAIRNGQVLSSGGGVANSDTEGVVTLREVVIDSSSAPAGGGIWNGGTITLEDSQVGPNGSAGAGGIYNRGSLTVRRSTFSGNGSAGSGAAGVFNHSDGTAIIEDSAIVDNSAGGPGAPGGISNAGTMTIRNTTVSGNIGGWGGVGIDNSGTLTVESATVTNNNSSGPGGSGIASAGGIANREGGTLTLQNSIVAGNTGDSGATNDCSGTIDSPGYNLIGDTTGCTITGDTTGNITGVDPLLGPLADNGGPTQTHALLPGSPAIDAGDDANCPATDQRGVPRPQGAGCDIGAFEAAPALVGGTSAGASEINVTDEGSFDLGDTIVINPGGDTEETNEVVGFGSLLLAQPLQFSHEAGETVAKVASATPAPTSTPTPSPTPSGETASATPTPTPTPTATGTPGPVLTQGDNDCDGDVDSVDALKGLQHVAAIGFSQEEGCPVLGDALPAAVPAGEPPDLFGDVDCDDDVDAVDQLKILQSVAAIPFTQNEPCTDIGKTL